MISNTDNAYLSLLIGATSPQNPTGCAWSEQCLVNTYDTDSLMDLLIPFIMLQISVWSYVTDTDFSVCSATFKYWDMPSLSEAIRIYGLFI